MRKRLMSRWPNLGPRHDDGVLRGEGVWEHVAEREDARDGFTTMMWDEINQKTSSAPQLLPCARSTVAQVNAARRGGGR